MSHSTQKQVVLRYAKLITHGNVEQLDEILEPDFAFANSEGEGLEGREQIKGAWEYFRNIFDPEIFRWEILEMFEEGKVVTATWIIHVKHIGVFKGYAPTNKEAEYQGMSLFRFSENGKLSKFYGYPGTLKLFADLGLFHVPG